MSGGAFNGAFQMGALKFIHDHWNELFPGRPVMKFDIITGVSVGALNGALIASNRYVELTDLWERVKNNGVEEIFTSNYIDTKSKSETLQFKIRIPWYKQIALIIWPPFRNKFFKQLRSLADNAPLKDKLKTITKASIQTPYRCGIVTMNGDAPYYGISPEDCLTDKDFQNAILASSAMPIIWTPVKQITKADGSVIKNTVDGGVRTVTPLGDAIKFVKDDPGSDYLIVIVNCASYQVDPASDEAGLDTANIAEIALRTAVLTSQNEILNDDIAWFLKINDILDQVKSSGIIVEDYDHITRRRSGRTKPLKEFEYILIQPDPLVMGDELVATKPLIERRIAHGEAIADQQFISRPVIW